MVETSFFKFGDDGFRKSPKLNIRIAFCAINTFHISSVGCQKCCTCDLKY